MAVQTDTSGQPAAAGQRWYATSPDEVAAGLGVDTGHGVVGLVDFRDDAARIVQVALACFRHPHMARGAIKQFHAQPLLQRSYCARDGRRRHAEAARAGREALLLGHGHVDSHQVKAVHLRFTMKSIKCRTRIGMRLRCG